MQELKWIASTFLATTLLLGGCGGGSDALGVSTSSVHFSALYLDAPPPDQHVILTVHDSNAAAVGAAYTHGRSPPSWLAANALTPVSGKPGTYDLDLSIIRTDITPGKASTVLTVGTADANGNVLATQDIAIDYTLVNRLVVTTPPITVNTILGGAAPATSSIAVVANGLSYMATSNTGWLKVPAGTQTGSGNIAIQTDTTGLSPGKYVGTVTLTDTAKSSDTATLEVTLFIDSNRVEVSRYGVGLSSFPGGGNLTQSITVSSANGRSDLPWQAMSDQPWLTATLAGTSSDSLTLTANPSGLTPNTAYIAHVIVTSNDSGIANQQIIRVGLWVGSTAPSQADITLPSYGSRSWVIASDPAAPFVYVAPAQMYSRDPAVYVYNIFTGALVHSYATDLTAVSAIALSNDGSTLFYPNSTSIVSFNTDTMTTSTSYPGYAMAGAGSGYSTGVSSYAAPDNHPVFVTGYGDLYDLEQSKTVGTGVVAPGNYYSVPRSPVTSPNQKDTYLLASGGSVTHHVRYHYSSAADTVFAAPLVAPQNNGSQSVIVSPRSDHIALFTGWSTSAAAFRIVDAQSGVDIKVINAPLYTNANMVGFTGDHRFVADGTSSGLNLMAWTYDDDGTLVSTSVVGNSGTSSILGSAVSGDGSRYAAVISTDNQATLALRNIPLP